jgi:hypothetical protein
MATVEPQSTPQSSIAPCNLNDDGGVQAPRARLGMASLRSYPNLGIGEGLVASSLRC